VACKTASPPQSSLTAAQVVHNSVERMGTVSAFHFELEQAGGGTPISEGLELNRATGDVSRPDKLKTTITATVAGMLLEVSVITVGTTTYMTNPFTKEWELLPSEFTAVSLFDPGTGITAILDSISGINLVEDESVDGITCYHITGEIFSEDLQPITLSSLVGTRIDIEIWIDQDEFLLHQVRLEGKITEDEIPGIVREIKLSSFNQEVEINLPN